MKQAISYFNKSPLAARDFLINRKVILGLPAEMAQFIFDNHSKLSKRKLGDFLGDRSSFSQKVCDHLLLKYSFSGMTLDEALRAVVRLFCLPKETQQIDRILEKFAKTYYQQNSDCTTTMPCENEDAAYVLLFSLLMLNTDLYNKSVPHEKKMTKDQFIRNNRGKLLEQSIVGFPYVSFI
jgi:Sec7-like guanine-nucleotide exchange factor